MKSCFCCKYRFFTECEKGYRFGVVCNNYEFSKHNADSQPSIFAKTEYNDTIHELRAQQKIKYDNENDCWIWKDKEDDQ